MRISDWSSDVCSSDLFQKSIEARAPASIKALAVDLDCYARFSAERGGIGLPADEARLVAYIDYCEARRLKPATVSRRLSSLAVAHHLLDVPCPVGAVVVRSEEHTSELQSLMRSSYAAFCLQKKITIMPV